MKQPSTKPVFFKADTFFYLIMFNLQLIIPQCCMIYKCERLTFKLKNNHKLVPRTRWNITMRRIMIKFVSVCHCEAFVCFVGLKRCEMKVERSACVNVDVDESVGLWKCVNSCSWEESVEGVRQLDTDALLVRKTLLS